MSDRSGQVLGSYRLETVIGHGNMADVYRATQLGLDNTVAIKLIHPHLLEQPSLVERFKREAEVMASLRHPNIVRLFDFVCRSDVAYMVMEYLAGGTLEQRLTQARESGTQISPEMAERWLTAIAAAVDTAHSHGLVHRDLKPANILFRESGEPVLTDFGLVFLTDRSRLSPSNSMTGTPVYISPEQARGLPGDTRSDIYSLGVILYEILVGQTPFQGPTISVAMKHVVEPPPSPRQLGRYLPAEIESVMMRALAKNPVERYQSAGALALALSSAVRQAEKEKQAAKPPAPRPVIYRAPFRTAAPATANATAAKARPAKPSAPAGSLWQRLVGPAFLVGLVSLGVWAVLSSGQSPAPSTAPLYAVGAEVTVVVPGGGSTSALRGCPSVFWMGVVGMATDGDNGQVISRQVCGTDWWYEVTWPDSASSAWDGKGWVSGANLAPR